MLARDLTFIWTARKKMKYNFAREVWVIFMGDFLYLKLRQKFSHLISVCIGYTNIY